MQSRHRILTLLFLLCFLSAYVSLKTSFGVLTCDDAYITLAHARSWIEGLGPVMSRWNPVSATSTPLHTAQMALAGLLFPRADAGALAFAVNALWDSVGFLFLYLLAAGRLGLSRPMAFFVVSGYALSVLALSVSASGMETSMYVALALAGAWAAFDEFRVPRLRPLLLAVCFLAPLARPEGALLPAVLILARLRREGPKRSGPYIAAAAAGFALFFAFYLRAYGHLLPHSVVAKRLEMRLGFVPSLTSWVLNVFYKGPCLGGTTLVTLLNAAAVLAAAAGFARRRGGAFPWALFAWPAAYFLFFLATRSSYLWSTWYYLPVLPFLLLLVATGLDRLLPERGAWILLFVLVAYVPFQTWRQRIPEKHRLAHAAREGRYREAARLLDSASAAGPTPGRGDAPLVMFDEVGALGYFSHVRILDTHGLLSPEALPYLSGPPDDWKRMRALRDRFSPDWIMAARPAEKEGRPETGEAGIYAGYQVTRELRAPGNPFVIELWRRTGAP